MTGALNKVWLAGLILGAAGIAVSRGAALSPGGDFFRDVVVENRFFSPPSVPILRVRTAQACRLNVLVYDSDNRVVALESPANLGTEWKLALEKLPPLSDGLYLFCLVAGDESAKRLAVYPADPGGGETIKVAEAQLDREHRTINYILPHAARVRSRVGFKDGPYLQPLLSWQAQPAGRHSIPWDGKCQNGIFQNLYENPVAQVIVTAVSLPANILVAENTAEKPGSQHRAAEAVSVPSGLADLTSPPWSKRKFMQVSSAGMWMGKDYRVLLAIHVNAEDQTVTLGVNCHPDDRERLLNRRFELTMFLDGVYISEDEVGLLPFNHRMATRGITPGKHALTVNVVDSDGNVGAASEEFVVVSAKGSFHENK